MPVLFLIVFIDLLGFGIVLPLFPFVAERLGASPWLITFGGAGIYSLAQVIATPLWGRLSDAYGRKPILMVSMLGSALSYLMLGAAGTLAALFVARAVGGLMSGNISAAFAYAADVSTPENRAKRIGMVGAAFGLGFMFGPFIGGMLGGNDPETMNFERPAMLAMGLSVLAFLGTTFVLKESLPREQRRPFGTRTERGGSPVAVLRNNPALGGIVGAMLVVSVAATLMQSVFPVWAHDVLTLGPKQVGIVFFVSGLIAVICQAGLIGPLTQRLGEKRVIYWACALYGVGMVLLAAAAVGGPWLMWVGTSLASAGQGFFNPAAASLVSLEADPRDRGAAMGASQSASAVGRIIGPATSGAIYTSIGHAAPYALAALLVLPAVWLLRNSHKGDAPHPSPEPTAP